MEDSVVVGPGRPWVRLEPEIDSLTGKRWAWKLVVAFDPDWQDFALDNTEGQGMEFRLHLPDDHLHEMIAAARSAIMFPNRPRDADAV